MKKILFALLSMLFFVSVNAYAQEQGEQKQPTPEEMAAKEADRLADLLKLEYWQVFYVDSTLAFEIFDLRKQLFYFLFHILFVNKPVPQNHLQI